MPGIRLHVLTLASAFIQPAPETVSGVAGCAAQLKLCGAEPPGRFRWDGMSEYGVRLLSAVFLNPTRDDVAGVADVSCSASAGHAQQRLTVDGQSSNRKRGLKAAL